jgi:hypothetical protein
VVPSIGGARLSELGTSLGFAQRKYTLLTSFVLLCSYTLSRTDEQDAGSCQGGTTASFL